MFPFSYIKQFEFEADQLTDGEMSEIFDAFKEQFYNPKTNANTLSFSSFNMILKRHRWLDGGSLSINRSENKLTVKIELHFYLISFILVAISMGYLIVDHDRIWIGLFVMSAFLSLFTFLYLWTTSMYRLSIKHTIQRQLTDLKIERTPTFVAVTDICPACGEAISKAMNSCPNCGLNFGAE